MNASNGYYHEDLAVGYILYVFLFVFMTIRQLYCRIESAILPSVCDLKSNMSALAHTRVMRPEVVHYRMT